MIGRHQFDQESKNMYTFIRKWRFQFLYNCLRILTFFVNLIMTYRAETFCSSDNGIKNCCV